jgi:hypothetical protein
MFLFRPPDAPIEEPAYSAVPFQLRSTYEECHQCLALTANDELVEIFDQAGMSPTGRWFRIRPTTPARLIPLGDGWETQGHDLAPVDIRDPHWKSKAQAWRAEQRALALDEELPASSKPAPQKPRF